MDIENILTVEDVARILQVKAITVREMFREKRLRAFKMGKSWRTTKQMLEEDVTALSQRVEESSSSTGKKRGRPRKSVEETASPPVEPRPAAPAAIPAPKAAAEPPPAPAAEPRQRATKQGPAKPKSDEADDTQQFLF